MESKFEVPVSVVGPPAVDFGKGKWQGLVGAGGEWFLNCHVLLPVPKT